MYPCMYVHVQLTIIHRYLFQQQLEINKKRERETKTLHIVNLVMLVATLFSIFVLTWPSKINLADIMISVH